MELKAKIEAIIYAAEEPITMEQIALLVKDIVLARDSVTDSASGVRKAFAQGDIETLRLLVPAATLEFLQSPAARAIAERLRHDMKEA